MSRVRAFRLEDIPEVAALWLRSFHGRTGSTEEGVRRYFREVFFDHPFRDPSLPSLVYEDEGRAVGFIGALPRQMLFRGEKIKAVVATQLMVEPGPGRGLAALDLHRALFSGPQDLTFSDGANEPAQRIWERAGGQVTQLYSLEWTRVLRPASFARDRLEHRTRSSTLNAAMPVFEAADAIARRLPIGFSQPPPSRMVEEVGSAETILAIVLRGTQSLRPAYDHASLSWLLAKARETKKHGTLRSRCIRDASGAPVGWYVYYAKPFGVSQVLQFGGKRSAIPDVLRSLFRDAWNEGSVAVSGQAEPLFLKELTDQRSTFKCRSLGALAQSRHTEVLSAIHRGDSLLTRLDGEWWLRFSADILDPPREEAGSK